MLTNGAPLRAWTVFCNTRSGVPLYLAAGHRLYDRQGPRCMDAASVQLNKPACVGTLCYAPVQVAMATA
jgi:hypothetical protein